MKKGDIQPTFSMIISLVITFAIVSIAGFVAYAAFSEEREARKNFEDFVEFFQELAENNEGFEGDKPLYVHKDYVIIGFSGNDIDFPDDGCYGWVIGDGGNNLKIKKPERCGGGGCLCLCDYGDSIVVDENEIKTKYGDWINDPRRSQLSNISKPYGKFEGPSNFIFSTKDICTGRKDVCINEKIEKLSFLGGKEDNQCDFFFISGIVKKSTSSGIKLVERGIDQVSIIKKENEVYSGRIYSS